MFFGDVVNQFLDQHGFAHTGTTKQTDLATLAIGRQQVDHLDPCFKNLGLGFQLGQLWCFAVNRSRRRGVDRALLINGFSQNVEDATKGGFTDGHGDGSSGIDSLHATHQTVGAAHGNGTHAMVAEELLHLCCEGDILAAGVFALNPESVVDPRQFPGWEFHVQNRANHLTNHALGAGGCRSRSDHK